MQCNTIDGYSYASVHNITMVRIDVSLTTVSVTVNDLGTQTEVFNVSVYYMLLSDPLIGTQSVTLQSQATATLIFSWHLSSYGRYEIRAEVITDLGEINVGNDTQTKSFYSWSMIGTDNEHRPNWQRTKQRRIRPKNFDASLRQHEILD